MIKLIQVKADINTSSNNGTITYIGGDVDPITGGLRKVLKPRVVKVYKDLWLKIYHRVKEKYHWHITDHKDDNLSW